MAENFFMSAELDAIAEKIAALPLVLDQARVLEIQAQEMRIAALNAQATSFEIASDVLEQQYTAGRLSHLEVVQAVATMSDLDPQLAGLRKGMRADRIVSIFRALQPDTPVVGLYGKRDTLTGVVSAPATVTDLMLRKSPSPVTRGQRFMAPYAEVRVPLRTIDNHGTVKEVDVVTGVDRLFTATVGWVAVQALVNSVKSTIIPHPMQPKSVKDSNGFELKALKKHICNLQILGVAPFDLSALDTQIALNI